jgi:hypothetical protein
MDWGSKLRGEIATSERVLELGVVMVTSDCVLRAACGNGAERLGFGAA